MYYSRKINGKKKMLAPPARRMQIETEAIKQKLEEMRKAMDKKKCLETPIKTNPNKKYAKLLERKRQGKNKDKLKQTKDYKKQVKPLKRGVQPSNLMRRGRLGGSNAHRGKPKFKIDASSMFKIKESKSRVGFRKKINALRKMTSIKGRNTISTASSRTAQNRYVTLDDSFDNNTISKTIVRVKTHTDEEIQRTEIDNLESISSSAQNFDQDTPESKLFKSSPFVRLSVNSGENGVKEFLEKSGLKKFIGLFFENEITDMETLRAVDDSHLDSMGVPKGFRIKLKKKLKEEFIEAQSQRKEAELSETNREKKNKFNNYLDTEVGNLSVISSEDLASEERDIVNELERPSRYTVLKQVKKTTKLEKTQTCSAQVGTDKMSNPRSACYNCYQIISQEKVTNSFSGDREFCSERCLKLFLLSQTISCANRSCRQLSNRMDCIYGQGGYYCSKQCFETIPKAPSTSEVKQLESISELVEDEGKDTEQQEEYFEDFGEIDLDFSDLI